MTTSPAYAYGKLDDHDVLRVGFGAMQLEHGDPADAIRVLRHAIELGVDHIDTAQFYRTVNDLIRTALHPYPAKLRIVTKVGAVTHQTKRLVTAQKPAELRASVEENLRALGTDHLAVVNLRRADVPPGDRRHRRPGGRSGQSTGRADRPARRGRNRRHRPEPRQSRPTAAGSSSRHRLRAEPVQRPHPWPRRRADRVRRAGRRLGAVLPARIGLRPAAQRDRQPGCHRARPAPRVSPRLRPGWPGCSGTARPRC